MKRTSLICIFIFLVHTIYAQLNSTKEYSLTDKKALLLPDSLTRTTDDIANFVNVNFKTEKEKTRAIFIWIASNIQYDVANMFAINFDEKTEEKIAKPLKTRKGICENYAALFNDICTKSGIKSYVVEGYTRINGNVNTVPHAWCAALVDSSWYLFDPTWGAGYVNDSKFYKKINNDYFKVSPSALINSHMPFDYLFQFLNYTISNQDFYDGKTRPDKSKPYFNYCDSLKVHDTLSQLGQLEAAARRVEQNGVKNSMVFDMLRHIKLKIEEIKAETEYKIQNRNVNLYNQAVANINDGVNYYNEFIRYQNKQFTPTKPDQEIQHMLDLAENKYNEAKNKLDSIEKPDANLTTLILQINKSLSESEAMLQEQKGWLLKYFAKGNIGRKAMFYEWSGKPWK